MDKRLLTVALVILISIVACKKVEQPAPKPQDLPEFNRELIIGKWEAIRLSIESYSKGEMYAKNTWVKDSGQISKSGNLVEPWLPYMVSMLTFSSDNTFNHIKPDGTPDSYMLAGILAANGRWSLNKDSFTMTTVYGSSNRDVPWGSAYSQDNEGKLIVGLSKIVVDTTGGNDIEHHYIIIIKKQ